MHLGEIVSKYRKRYDVTMEEFARRSGLSKGYISMLEKIYNPNTKEEIAPSVDAIKKVSSVIGVSFNELFSMMEGEDVEVSHLPSSDVISLPFLGYGSCGVGVLNEEAVEWRDVPFWIIGNKINGEDYFLAYARGDSMERAGIKDNALLLFRRQPELNNGEIGVFNLNGEEYIKRYKHHDNVVILSSESNSNEHGPIIVTKDDDFRIIAKLIKGIIDFD